MRSHWDPTLAQDPCESAWVYLKRFKVIRWPSSFPWNETIDIFIDHLIPHEHRVLDYMAGGSLINCSYGEIWDLIHERAEFTKYINDVQGLYWNSNITQAPDEPAWKYLERFMSYMEGCTDRHIWHDTAVFFDNIILKEYRELDYMAGGSIMYCTPTEIWNLINERADSEFESEMRKQQAEKEQAEMWRMLSELSHEVQKLRCCRQEMSAEPSKFGLDDTEVTVAMDKQVDEIISNEALHGESICTDDNPSKELTPLVQSDMILQPNIVRNCMSILPPITNIFLSSHLQDHIIKEAVRKDQVWGSHNEVETYNLKIRACKQVSSSDKSLDKLRINWKSRRKSKRGILNEGWDPWIGVSHTLMKQVKRVVRKFDGAHPWDPNIR